MSVSLASVFQFSVLLSVGLLERLSVGFIAVCSSVFCTSVRQFSVLLSVGFLGVPVCLLSGCLSVYINQVHYTTKSFFPTTLLSWLALRLNNSTRA